MECGQAKLPLTCPRDPAIGDLEEIFALERGTHSLRARARYWRSAIGLVVRLRPRRNRHAQPALPKMRGDSVMAVLWKDLLMVFDFSSSSRGMRWPLW